MEFSSRRAAGLFAGDTEMTHNRFLTLQNPPKCIASETPRGFKTGSCDSLAAREENFRFALKIL